MTLQIKLNSCLSSINWKDQFARLTESIYVYIRWRQIRQEPWILLWSTKIAKTNLAWLSWKSLDIILAGFAIFGRVKWDTHERFENGRMETIFIILPFSFFWGVCVFYGKIFSTNLFNFSCLNWCKTTKCTYK